MDIHNAHVMVDGHLVSAKAQRVVHAIKDYCYEIEVKWIPPAQRKEGEAAFAIIHDAPGNAPYVMFYVVDDADFDERVLHRIIRNDQRNGKAVLGELEAWEEAQKRIKHQEYLDQMEEAADIAAHILRTPLNTYKVNDNLVIKDGIPFNSARRN